MRFEILRHAKLLKTSKLLLPIHWRLFSTLTSTNTFLHCLRKQIASSKIAVIDHCGNHAYEKLHKHSDVLSQRINRLLSKYPQQRIAVLLPNNVLYAISMIATWKSGHTFVPLSQLYPETQLEYFLNDSQATLLMSTEEHADKVRSLSRTTGVRALILDMKDNFQEPLVELEKSTGFLDDGFLKDAKALIVYTSGTTGPPKGVVLSHVNLHHQVKALVNSCGITENDVILHTLPLHHVHGIIAALLSVLAAGGTCVILPKFDAKKVWQRLIDTTDGPGCVNLFMAVPTIYAKLIEQYDREYADLPQKRDHIRAVFKDKIRLMTSGSASLPDTVLARLQEITSHGLQERYGLSEVGSALSNPLEGKRRAGSVGTPMYGFEVRIAKPNTNTSLGYEIICHSTTSETTVTPGTDGEIGELHIKGPAVFSEYWNKPKETRATFTQDGWFKTGDTFRFEDGAYRIVGRTSVDVIKSGGFKISALDVERALLSHELVSECAVLGLPDMTWGQRVAAVVVLKTTHAQVSSKMEGTITENLKQFCKSKLPTYSVPTIFKITDTIQKNAMGKVNKKELMKIIFHK